MAQTIDLGRVMGAGVSAGGTTGQVLSKASDADYETVWIDPPSGKAEDADKLGGVPASEYYNKDNLIFDDALVEGSTNPITSGAVYSAMHPERQYIPLTMANGATLNEPGNSYYVLIDGLCFVNMAGISIPTNGTGIITNLPKAARRSNTQIRIGDTYPIIYIDGGATVINSTVLFGSALYIQLVYPVAEG